MENIYLLESVEFFLGIWGERIFKYGAGHYLRSVLPEIGIYAPSGRFAEFGREDMSQAFGDFPARGFGMTYGGGAQRKNKEPAYV